MPAPPRMYQPIGIGVSAEKYLEFAKQKHDLTVKMCIKLSNFLGTLGPQKEADEFTTALSSLLNLETSQEIEELEKAPGPCVDAEFCPSAYDMSGEIEQLSRCVEKAERLKEHVARIRAGLDATPPELQANIQAAIAYFENEQINAERERDFIQKQIESHQGQGERTT